MHVGVVYTYSWMWMRPPPRQYQGRPTPVQSPKRWRHPCNHRKGEPLSNGEDTEAMPNQKRSLGGNAKSKRSLGCRERCDRHLSFRLSDFSIGHCFGIMMSVSRRTFFNCIRICVYQETQYAISEQFSSYTTCHEIDLVWPSVLPM